MNIEISMNLGAEPEPGDRFFIAELEWTNENGEFLAEIGIVDKEFNKQELIDAFEAEGNTSVKVISVREFFEREKYEAYKKE